MKTLSDVVNTSEKLIQKSLDIMKKTRKFVTDQREIPNVTDAAVNDAHSPAAKNVQQYHFRPLSHSYHPC